MGRLFEDLHNSHVKHRFKDIEDTYNRFHTPTGVDGDAFTFMPEFVVASEEYL